MSKFDMEGLEARLAGYLAACAKAGDDHWREMDYKHSAPPRYELEAGPRYVKIIKRDANGSSASVHSFIDRSNGNILKAASYRAPAKHPRGNVYEADFGAKSAGISFCGVRYL